MKISFEGHLVATDKTRTFTRHYLPKNEDIIRESAQNIEFQARLLEASCIAARRIFQERQSLE